MQKLLNNRKIKIIGAAVLAVAAICILVWAFQRDNPTFMYESIKECDANPPFEDVYWGMTVPEFCEAMGVEESDLVLAEPITYDELHGGGVFALEYWASDYGVSAEDMPLYEHYENHFDVPLNRELLGSEDYYVNGKPQTIRAVFTDETTWDGKTVPPLLCQLIFQAPPEAEYHFYDEFYLFYHGEKAPSGIAALGIHGSLIAGNVKAPAMMLSKLYSSGMSPEEIAAYNITPRMDSEDIDELDIYYPLYSEVRPSDPQILSHATQDESTFEVTEVVFYMEAGYLAYYEWFLNEMT